MHPIAPGRLTRHPTSHLAREQVFVALDVETTGLLATQDRVVEVGLVAFRGSGEVLEEFVTLLNAPGSPPEVRRIHRIDDAYLVGAPSWDQVWPALTSYLQGRVLVAHNLPFDVSFVQAESARHAVEGLPAVPGVCTLETARRHLHAKSYSMKSLHKSVSGEWRDTDHTALGDARACMDVVLWLINTCPEPLWVDHPCTDPSRARTAVEVPAQRRPAAAERRPPPWEENPAIESAPEASGPRENLTPEERAAQAAAKAAQWGHTWREVELPEDPGPTRRPLQTPAEQVRCAKL